MLLAVCSRPIPLLHEGVFGLVLMCFGFLFVGGFFFFLIGNGDCNTIETDMGSGVLGQFLHHLCFSKMFSLFQAVMLKK